MHPLHPWMTAQLVESRHRTVHAGVSEARRARERGRSWATRAMVRLAARLTRMRVVARRPGTEWEEPWSTCGAISTSRP